MGKFHGVLLVSDFDDTLIGSSLALSDENRAAILRFMKEGGRFTIATGRSHLTFVPQVPMVPMNAPVVLSNGAALYDFQTDRLLFQSTLPTRVVSDLYEVIGQFPDIGFEAYHGEEMYAFQPNQITRNHAKKVGISYTTCTDPAQIPQPLVKVIFQQHTGLLRQVQAYIRERWSDVYEIIFSNRHLLELTALGSTKGEQVRRLTRLLSIDLAHLYCVGDNQNDLPMLELAKIGFCPADAAEEVQSKPFVQRVSSSDDHCIADVISRLTQLY
ncbi:MAG: HAD-IIB family hydrolase [Oscillospiraceae bacterium]|nr:HAD-IIB family hydrolase [Oscillospiraceae bacterium]